MTLLCAAILVEDLPQARRAAAAAAETGADCVEYRIDRLSDADQVRRLTEQSILPCIVTCRPPDEGGQSSLDSRQRVALLAAAAGPALRYLDVELATLKQTGPQALAGRPLMVSSHDFAGRPDRLHNILLELNAAPAAAVKIVWTARTVRDNLEAFEILRRRAQPTVALCMGEPGLISRVLAKKFGALLTFAATDEPSATAPGQLSIATVKQLYRWDAIGPATKVYGVVACPVGHSMSPAVHNAAMAHLGYDGVYLPLLVEEGYESFKAFMESFLAMESLDLCGLSVTIPHKENALRYLVEKGARIDDLARTIGAVNTIVIERAGGQPTLRGMNTDCAAIIETITAALGIDPANLKDLRVAVLGAGGTCRAAVAGLVRHGARVLVANRTLPRAAAMAREFAGVTACPLEALANERCDIYINTTPVGMHPNVHQSPLGDRLMPLTPDTLVFDTIYNPMKTKLLAQAQAAGARIIGGVDMFVRQAAAQLTAWTGRPAPLPLMRQVMETKLGAKAQ